MTLEFLCIQTTTIYISAILQQSRTPLGPRDRRQVSAFYMRCSAKKCGPSHLHAVRQRNPSVNRHRVRISRISRVATQRVTNILRFGLLSLPAGGSFPLLGQTTGKRSASLMKGLSDATTRLTSTARVLARSPSCTAHLSLVKTLQIHKTNAIKERHQKESR